MSASSAPKNPSVHQPAHQSGQGAAGAAPLFARDVIALYAEALPDVRFPDLDLALLQRSAEDLHSAQLAVAAAAAQLEAARDAAYGQAELLSMRAERALAYARVFADGDAKLTDRIAELCRSRVDKATSHNEAGASKKRGRPKKSDSDTSLFSSPQAVPVEAFSENAA